MNNYTVYHLHTHVSNLTGAGMDSVTLFKDYIKQAKEEGMTAIGFSEHGNIFQWKKKRDACEAAGLKYIHGVEIYVTEKLLWETEDNPDPHKIRDNYHVVLIAKNLKGMKELNGLVSSGFKEEQRYYAPRITFDQLIGTSENILITSACVGGILCKGNDNLKERFVNFLLDNKDRVFLEIQHHNTQKQIQYNKYLYELNQKYGLRLIAGTDTHAINEEQAKARVILQKSKKEVFNDDEAGWDLTWKSYNELCDSYFVQDSIPESAYLEAIENTNVLADMVEGYELDKTFKYPKIFDNSTELLRSKLFSEESIQYAVEDGFTRQEVVDRLTEEMETFIAVDAVDYILLQEYIANWCHKNDIWCGPARGSAASSLSLYVLRVTEVNPLKHKFAFWRFMHKDKYSLADVDLDWAPSDRDRTKYWMLHDKMDIPTMFTTEIITFNTLALRGAIRDVGRGLEIPLDEVDAICKAIHEESDGENKVTVIDDSWKKKYSELFHYVDLVQGVCTSIGAHASGIVVSTLNLSEEIGTCYISGDEYPVSVLDMKELDSLNFVKEDVLGLENVGCINETCKFAEIPKLSAKTISLDDDAVYESVKEDTSLIFEFNSPYGQKTVSKMFSPTVWNKIKKQNPLIAKFDLLTYISALIRPCGKGVYDEAVNGNNYVSGIKPIDKLLSNEMGYPIMQESQMSFVQKFCGYDFLKADKLRKCVAAGTPVLMADGKWRLIENIKVGEEVISYKDGKPVKRKVVGVYDNGRAPTVFIFFNDRVNFLSCTPDHKILTPKGYVKAKELRVGSAIIGLTNYNVQKDFALDYVDSVDLGYTRQVYDLEIEDTHNYVAGLIVTHNCISKKLGTKEQLPVIKEAFERNAKIQLNISDKKSDEIMNIFLNCILYATRYSFSSIHAYSYTYISYECAWLRYYYPLEFLTACFNAWNSNEDKTKEAVEYAAKRKIAILAPKFRHSKAEYFFDKEENAIYKGTSSIKGISESHSNTLYNLRERKYDSFIDLLYDIKELKVPANQVKTLILLDYFSEFGTSKELSLIYNQFTFFKFGEAASISKSKVTDKTLEDIIRRNSNETAKQFNKMNGMRILKEVEQYIMCLNLGESDFKTKCMNQLEYLGYIDYKTGKREDGPTIFVLNTKTLKSKIDNKPWAIVIEGQSLGSGKRTEYTIKYTTYQKEQFAKNDIIRIKDWFKNSKGYFYINSYELVL